MAGGGSGGGGGKGGSKPQDDLFIGASPGARKPKGFMDALSEIQQYYVVERQGSEIPEDFLTWNGKMALMEVGFKSGVISTIISAVLAPFFLALMGGKLFGGYEPTTFDKVFACILSVSFTLGYSFFIAKLGSYYIGRITKAAIRNVLYGYMPGVLLIAVVAFLAFNLVYIKVLEPNFLARTILSMKDWVEYSTLNKIYGWLLGLRNIMVTSWVYVDLTAVVSIAIPWIAIGINSRKARKRIAYEEQWK